MTAETARTSPLKTGKIRSMTDTVVNLHLGIDEALVLFEMLADFQSAPSLTVTTPAERLALIRLHGVLETTLVEPLRPDYRELLGAARVRLKEQLGNVEE